MIVRRVLRSSALLFIVSAGVVGCGDLNSGRAGQVVEGHVTKVLETSIRASFGSPDTLVQRLEIAVDSGLFRGELTAVEWRGRGALNDYGLLAAGDQVLLTETISGSQRLYAIQEVVRLPAVAPLAALLVLALAAVGWKQGAASILGLAGSAVVLFFFVLPSIRGGGDPLVVALLGSAGVLAVSVPGVHGMNRKSLAALGGTLAGLAIVGVLSAIAVRTAHMTGLASEEAILVSVGGVVRIDTGRLVLAGLVVASLGALVDMGVGQASATFELAAAHDGLRGRTLYASALRVGRDHIGSLVNTLVFAFFGGALPLIVLLSFGYLPLSSALNNEQIVGAILQAVIASIGLVLCVPVTTAIAVALASRQAAGLRTEID